MKKMSLLFMKLLLLFAIATIFQLPCTAQKIPSAGNNNQANTVSLSEVLKELRSKLGAYILFEDKLVEGLKVPAGLINASESMEKNLDNILKSLPLNYKKVKDKTYLIVAGKTNKLNGAAFMDSPAGSKNEYGYGPGVFEAKEDTQNSAGNFHNVKYFVPADITLSGTVKDDKGVPLAAISVTEKGTANAVATDERGNYKIVLKNGGTTLEFSATGFVTREVTIGDNPVINVVLRSSTKDLDDVVVVGYGKQRKVTSVGAQSSISTKELVQSPVANISNSLVGRMSGLFAIQGSGEPGADQSRILIRGIGTFSGTGAPLILVDGIQVDNYNNIDPNEIDGVTILKDASSTAVYGVRGANGVIIITTKRGRTGAPVVSYTFNNGINSFTAIRQQMNAFNYATSHNQALKNDAYVSAGIYTPKYTDADLALYQNHQDPIFHPDVNWYDVVLKKASMQQLHNLTVRGGTDKVKYFISAGMFNQSGLFRDQDIDAGFDPQVRYKRYNFRSNLNFDVTSRLKAAVDLSTQIENRTGNAAVTSGVINSLAAANPLGSPSIINGKIVTLSPSGIQGGNGDNPLTGIYTQGYKNDIRNFINTSVRLDYDLGSITPGLSMHGLVAYQTANRKVNTYIKPLITYQARKLADGSVIFAQQLDVSPFNYSTASPDRNRRITGEFGFDYKRSFGKHNVSGVLLYNQIKTYDPAYAFGVPNGYQNVAGRAVYDYNGRYLAEVNASYTGTENFAPGKRFGIFPAYSLGWVPTAEKFFPKTSIITFLKIRSSYGQVGNDQLSADYLTNTNGRFLYRPTSFTQTGSYSWGVVGSNYTPYPGAREGRVNNPGLTWERVVKYNLGVDATLLNGKVSLTLEFFKDKRDNILATPQTVSLLTGTTLAAQNLGKMTNKGFEGDVTYRDHVGAVNFWTKGNFSFARNKILFQDEVPKTFAYQNRTGQRFGQIFGLIAEGLYNSWDEVNDPNRPVTTYSPNNRLQPGDVKFRDVNGDGFINFQDQVPIGYSTIPEIIYGVSIGGDFKGFDFSVLFQGADHVSLQYSRRANQAFFDVNPAAAANYLLESWTADRYAQGLPINYPRFAVGNAFNNFTHNYESSTFWNVNGRYVRLKNAEIGYTFRPLLLRRIGIKSARIYANGNNLITWSGILPGIDPETANLGANNEPYPLVRTINTGVNITF